MTNFNYKARNASGKLISGMIEGDTREQALLKLSGKGLVPTSVDEVVPSKGSRIPFLSSFRKIKTSDINIFYVQLANMIGAGISILHSVETLSKQIENKKLQEAVYYVAADLKEGSSFSEALVKYPDVFPELFISMVRAGEASGKLDEVLKRYADFSEKQEELKQKIMGAVFYPVILLCGGIIITIFLVTFVIPNLMEMFINLKGDIPLPTMILYKVGLAIKKFWYLIILGILGILFGIKNYSSTASGGVVVDGLKLRLPLVGKLYQSIVVSRFTRTLGTLLESGVPILESLDITRGVVSNRVISDKILEVKEGVREGKTVADTMRAGKAFPVDVVEMIAVGEEAGSMDVMLTKIAYFYDMYIDYTTKKVATVMEPMLIVFLGSIVGFVMASMLIPIFKIVNLIKM